MRGRAEIAGIAIILMAGVSFASASVLAKVAYRESPVEAGTLVAVRLATGAVVLWLAAAGLRLPRRLPAGRAPVVAGLGLLQAAVGGLFFAALDRVGAGTATLLLYAHPALVTVLAVALGRERFGPVKALALGLGLGGVTLVLGTPGGRLDPTGAAMALGAALLLAVYVVGAQRAVQGVHPVIAGAWVLTGAAIAFAVPSAAAGGIDPSIGLEGWGWTLAVGISSGTAIALFLAAVARLGPSRSSIGATIEPVAAVVLSAAFLGERLTGPQLAGGALVVAAVALLPLVERGPVALGDAAPMSGDVDPP